MLAPVLLLLLLAGGAILLVRRSTGQPVAADAASPVAAQTGTGVPPSVRLGGWGFVVFFFGWVGGLVGYLILQDENRPRAKRVLTWGLAWTGIWIMATLALYATFFAMVATA